MDESKPSIASKSARKREQQALQRLGEALVDLSDDDIATLALDDRLLEAIADLKRMKSHEAKRRQKQYIGKLMRDVDAAPIQQFFDARADRERANKRLFARAERWRDQVLGEGRGALTAFREETQQPTEKLEQLLHDLEHATSDRSERTLRREIFREIHAALEADVPSG